MKHVVGLNVPIEVIVDLHLDHVLGGVLVGHDGADDMAGVVG